LWLVKQNKVLTKLNLVKKGWSGNTKCVFYDLDESTDHLFVSCKIINQIWQWIVKYNNFYFYVDTIQDSWQMDCCIPLKNKFVIEMVRGAVLWTVWLERNKLCFTDKQACSIPVLGNKIISLANYWCSQKGKVNLFKLSLVMSQEVGDLFMQVQEVPMWPEEGDTLANDGMKDKKNIRIGGGFSSTGNDTSGFEYSSHV
jgi:zinc-binding in reverse transcriptase